MNFSFDYQTVIAIGTPTVGALLFIFRAIMNVQTRLTRLETQMEPMWGHGGIMMQAMSSLIKQPIHFHKDELVDRFRDNTASMSTEEIQELKDILVAEYTDLEKVKDPKIIAYALFMKRVDQELADRREVHRKDAQGLLAKLCRVMALCK